MKTMYIAMYDESDNYIRDFRSSKECADYFKTSAKVIDCSICRIKTGRLKRKRDNINNRYVKLYRMRDN